MGFRFCRTPYVEAYRPLKIASKLVWQWSQRLFLMMRLCATEWEEKTTDFRCTTANCRFLRAGYHKNELKAPKKSTNQRLFDYLDSKRQKVDVTKPERKAPLVYMVDLMKAPFGHSASALCRLTSMSEHRAVSGNKMCLTVSSSSLWINKRTWCACNHTSERHALRDD